MVIEKNGKIYTVSESLDKWTVKAESGKLSIAYDVSKKLCPTADELRNYVINDNELF